MKKQKNFKLMKIEDNKNFNTNELKDKVNFPAKIIIPRINYSNLSEIKSPSKKTVKKGFFDKINSPKIIPKKIIEPFYEINKESTNCSLLQNADYITSPRVKKLDKAKNKLTEVNKFCLNRVQSHLNNKNNISSNQQQSTNQTIKINLINKSPRKLSSNNKSKNINSSARAKNTTNHMYKSKTNENFNRNNFTKSTKAIKNFKFGCVNSNNSNTANKKHREKKCIANLKSLITPSKYRLKKHYDNNCQEIHINIFQKINFKNNIVNNNEINDSFKSLSYSNRKRHKYYNHFHETEYKNNRRCTLNNDFMSSNSTTVNLNSEKIFKMKNNEVLTGYKKISSEQKEKRKIKYKNKSQNIIISRKEGTKSEKSFKSNLSNKSIINKKRNYNINNIKKNMMQNSNFIVVEDEKDNNNKNKEKEKDNEFKNTENSIVENAIDNTEVFPVTNKPISKTEAKIINLKLFNDFNTKLKTIVNKLHKYETCVDECFDWISSFFNDSFYKKEAGLFLNQLNKKNICYYIKIEILCYFLCYDISFNENFKQASILLKTIFNLIHKNLLLLFLYAINLKNNQKKTTEDTNEIDINEIKNNIESKLRMNFTAQDMNEDTIINLISNNSKEINNYYKIIIDNLYSINYGENTNNINNNFRFPGCLTININKLNDKEKLKIISTFFFDAYKLITNYNFKELQIFFDLYLYKQNNNQSISMQKSGKSIISLGNDSFALTHIQSNLKYTLVLELNKILVLQTKNKIILRDGLFEFLKKMKKVFELVVFSFDETGFIKDAIKLIEQNEKYFSCVLDKNKAVKDKDGKLVKDLSLLGRDIKKIIIIESSNNVSKIYKKNQIIIKKSDDDFNNNDDFLKILEDVLEKIVKESDINGDIRISLQPYIKSCKLFRYDL